MTILYDYKHFGGQHWETGGVRHHFAYRGFTNPHTDEPYSEALLMGVSGGAAVGYFTFSYEGHDPHVALLSRNTFEPMERMLGRLGCLQRIEQTGSARKGRQNLHDALDAGLPPLVWADVWSLPYNTRSEADEMWLMMPVVVFGATDDAIHIADRSTQPLHVAPEQFHAARAVTKKNKFRLMTIDAPQPDKLPSAVQMGIFDTLKLYTEKPPRGSAKRFGLMAFDTWRTQIIKGRWVDAFPPGRAYLNGLLTAYEAIGDGMERDLYAAFLEEAATILETPALTEAAAAFRAAIPDWQRLADALMEPFAEVGALSDTHRRLFREHGQTRIDEIRTTKARLEQIRDEVEAAFPLDQAAIADHMEHIAAGIDAVEAAEREAVKRLQAAMAG